MPEEIKEYINRYCPHPEVLTSNEITQIMYYSDEKNINMIEFKKNGHLIFRQRYPNFDTWFSLFTLVISMIVFLFKVF